MTGLVVVTDVADTVVVVVAKSHLTAATRNALCESSRFWQNAIGTMRTNLRCAAELSGVGSLGRLAELVRVLGGERTAPTLSIDAVGMRNPSQRFDNSRDDLLVRSAVVGEM